jgi:ATP-binding cassette, subfamily B, multidrug efflux pump
MARNKFDIDEVLDSPFNIKHFKRLTNYIKPYKNKVIVTTILMIVATISALSAP